MRWLTDGREPFPERAVLQAERVGQLAGRLRRGDVGEAPAEAIHHRLRKQDVAHQVEIQFSWPNGNGSKSGYSVLKVSSMGVMMCRMSVSSEPQWSTPRRAFL